MNKTLVNTFKRSELANTLAFHDFSNSTYDLKGWVTYIVNLFRKYGLEPTMMGISAPTVKSTKMHAYKVEIKKLDTVDNANITGITILSTMDGELDYRYEIFTATFSVGLKSSINNCVITLDNALVPLQKKIWEDIVGKTANFFKPRYGYGFQRLYKKGPGSYPSGICVLKYGDPEAKIIGCWSKAYRMPNGKYCTGDMRDIYPLNVLSSAHNQRMVEGMTLFDWINADTSRGSLTKLGEDLWSWWLKDEDSDSVRAALKPTGILLCAP